MRTHPSPGLVALLFACLAAVPSPRAAAADLQVTLPVITAAPGSSVSVPIEVTPGPAGLGIQSVQFRLDFAPGVLSSSASSPDGWIRSWGAPFVTANASFLAASAGGFPATTSSGTLLNTLTLTLSGAAIPGTDMPLAFTTLLFNEGTPTVAVTNGLLRVRTSVGVTPAGPGSFALSAPAPNPVRASAKFGLTVPGTSAGTVRVDVHGVDGRLVRRLVDGFLPPGRHELHWDARSASGAPVRAGLYFLRAACGEWRSERRLVVIR